MHVVILMAARSQAPSSGGIPDQITRLTDTHLWPYACQQNDDFFAQLCYDACVRKTLLRHDKELRAVFDSYSLLFNSDGSNISLKDAISNSEEDKSSKKAAKRASLNGKAMKVIHLMPISRFEVVLKDAGMLHGAMTGTVLRMILSGVQASTMDLNNSDSDGSEPEDFREENSGSGSLDSDTDSDEDAEARAQANGDQLCFPEFTDGLAALVLYLEPNPFEKYSTRFERFIKEKLLKALQTFWLEISPDTGLGVTLDELRRLQWLSDSKSQESRKAEPTSPEPQLAKESKKTKKDKA